MNKVSEFLINILRVFIVVALGILVISSFCYMNKIYPNDFSDKMFLIESITLIIGIFLILSKIRHKVKISILIIIAFLLRIFWIGSVNTLPISDFESMYEAAGEFLINDLTAFRDYNYLARFPHLVPMTLYMAFIIKIFPIYNLLVMKIVNVVLGIVSIYLLYKLSDFFIKSEKNKLFILLLGAVFPPFISYTSVLCSENIAIPLYLFSLLAFYKANNLSRKQHVHLFFVGSLLAISNLFRGVGIVFLIAFVIYSVLILKEHKLSSIVCLISGYIIVTVYISISLIAVGIIEKPLWDGAEPSNITLLLKGSNIESGGKWSEEDALFVDKYLRNENFNEICLNEIKERIFSMTFIEAWWFYINKFISQWSVGDCSGTYWAFEGTGNSFPTLLPLIFQVIYLGILVFSTVSLMNTKCKNSILIYILLCGFGLLFMIIETQPRYSYIICWAFLIMGTQGIEVVYNWYKKGITNVRKIKKVN